LNIDPGQRPISIDVEGQLSFNALAPRFEGTAVLALPAPKKGTDNAAVPWRLSAKFKADHSVVQLDQIEASYGAEDRALKFAGAGDIRFGASPLLHAVMSARQLDADKLLARDDSKDIAAMQPARLLPALHDLLKELPHAPIRSRIEASAEQIMLGGRPLQNVAIDFHGDATSWAIDRTDLGAPGNTRISFTRAGKLTPAPGDFSGALDVESGDPDVLLAWLQGKSDVVRRTQKALHLDGDVSANKDRVAIDALKAEIDGGTIEGRIAVSALASGAGSRVEAELKAERLDLDAATAFVRSVAGPEANWPEEGAVSLNIGNAISAGQEFKPFAARFAYSPKTLSLAQLKFGQTAGAMVEGSGNFDRTDATGRLTLNANGASLKQITAMVAPLAPGFASRLEAAANAPGPARLKLQLDIGKNAAKANLADAHAAVEVNAPQLNGTASITAKPELASLRSLDLNALGRAEVNIESRLSAERGDVLLALLGLDHVVASGDGGMQFEGSVNGVWHQPLRLNAKMWGAGIDAEAQGTAEPWTQAPKASVNLRIRSINLAPVFGFKPSDPMAQNIRLFARASLAGNKLTLDDIDSVAAGSRLRGRVAVTLDEERGIDGEFGLDSLDLAPAFVLAIGAAGHNPDEPLGAGLMKGWHGRVAFQALRGALPGGGELRPVSGAIKSDGQSLTFEALKGKVGGGEAVANIDARPDPNGIVINSRLDFSGVDGTALRYRGLKMPSGRTSLQMTLMSRGRSVAALAGALSGSGTMTLESASIAGLDPRAFEVAIRANDAGQATDDNRLKQIVAPVLAAGNLPVAAAQIPFNIRDGRLRIDATTLDAGNARVIVSGGYDMLADQADVRLSLSANAIGSGTSRPEIQIFAAGTPDALNPMLDVTSLSSWLAVRTIDRETRRLDAIERGEAPPTEPALMPPATAALPPALQPPAAEMVPLPGRDPRRLPPRATVAPRPPAAVIAPLPPVMSQQAAPLPPPIEVRPAPAPPRPKPPPRPPMVLTPPVSQP
jgi:large subunit ribosomal protein L24